MATATRTAKPRPLSQRPMEERYRQVLTDVEQFDPRLAGEKYAYGLWDLIQPQMTEYLQAHRGEEVGMGRLHTGGAQEEEDRVIRQGLQSFGGQVAMQAPVLSGQWLEAAGLRGELASGELNRKLLKEQMKRQRRGGLGASIGGLLGGAAGLAIGPLGPLAGATIGSMVGEGLGWNI